MDQGGVDERTVNPLSTARDPAPCGILNGQCSRESTTPDLVELVRGANDAVSRRDFDAAA
jgi:hypothetical protein